WATSFLQPLAGRVPLKAMLPALPRAIASLDLRASEQVITTSSAFAHHVRTAPGARQVCYCSAPPPFLWNQDEYCRGRSKQLIALAHLLQVLRRLNLAAAARVDAYIANSHYTAERIRTVYGRSAQVD